MIEDIHFQYNVIGYRFFHNVASGNRKAGSEAGHIRFSGHCTIRVKGIKYPRSHLMWLLEYGKLPTGYIQHIDDDLLNDEISNLVETDGTHKKGYNPTDP